MTNVRMTTARTVTSANSSQSSSRNSYTTPLTSPCPSPSELVSRSTVSGLSVGTNTGDETTIDETYMMSKSSLSRSTTQTLVGGHHGSFDQTEILDEVIRKLNSLMTLDGQLVRVEDQVRTMREQLQLTVKDVCNSLNQMKTDVKLTRSKTITKLNCNSNFRGDSLISNGQTNGSSPSYSSLQSTFLYSIKQQSPISQFPLVNEKMATKLRTLPALVKGYLTRRLMKTPRVQQLIKTIEDTMCFIESIRKDFVDENDELNVNTIRPQDAALFSQSNAMLNNALNEVHSIFFSYSKANQMKMIANYREIQKEQKFRRASSGVRNNSVNELKNFKRPSNNSSLLHQKRRSSMLSIPIIEESAKESKRVVSSPRIKPNDDKSGNINVVKPAKVDKRRRKNPLSSSSSTLSSESANISSRVTRDSIPRSPKAAQKRIPQRTKQYSPSPIVRKSQRRTTCKYKE